VSGQDELPGKVNYFIGNDPKKWRANVPTYAKVAYRDVYPGIDLVYYGNQDGELEYDFIVAPGADANAIALDVGAGLVPAQGRPQGSPLRIDRDGDLVISAKGGEIRFHKPEIYQPGEGSSLVTRHSSLVQGGFVLSARNRIHFAVGPYDHSKPLVIDPELVYSTYLGADNGTDRANGIAVDSSGNAYVTGMTVSDNFPTVNPFQATNKSPDGTVFVTKFNATGTALVYSTYLGGSGGDAGEAIAVDSAGSAYVTGWTCSSDFPTALPLQASLKGNCDPFVTKFNPAGAGLVYSTYLGGSSGNDRATGIAVDSSGNAYLTGDAFSSDFPTASALQPSLNGFENAFVSKLNAAGSALVYSTYLGGSNGDGGGGIAVDSSGNAYVTGFTTSSNFPTVNPFQAAPGRSDNMYGTAFVAKLNPAGSALVYSTYLGGSVEEEGRGVAVDSFGNAYVTGGTWSPDFPTVNPIETYQSKSGADNVFVTKFNAAGSALVYSTFLGGSGCLYNAGPSDCGDEGLGIGIDSRGVAYVAGETASPDFPTANAIQTTNGNTSGGGEEFTGFVACLNAAGSALAYSTYLGGNTYAIANAIAVDSSGDAYVTGISSGNFPTVNPVQSSPGAAFVAMISPPPAVTFFPGTLNFGTVLGGTTSPAESITLTPISNAAVSLTSITASGDFALVTMANSCAYGGGSLSGGSTCAINVTFTPTDTGTRTGALTITYTGAGSPETIALSGTGTAPAATLSPASLTFSGQDAGSTSSPQVVTLMNPGTVPLTVSNVAISAGWTQSNNCMPAVAANSSCTINVMFAPSVYGPQTGSLTLTDYASNSPQTVTLSGTALAPVANLSTSSLNFAGQTVSTQSAPQTITLTNAGNGTLTPLKITRTGSFAETNTCGSSVAAGASCAISVTFSPIGAGSASGTLTLTDNASTSPQTVELSGTGIDFALSSTTTSQTVSAGQTANYNLAVGSEDGFSQAVNLVCTGAPTASVCTVTPNTVTPNGTSAASVAVAVSTTASISQLAPPAGRLLPPGFTSLGRVFWLYGILGLASLATLAAARKRRAAYLLGACLLLAMLWTACGGGSNTPAPKTIPGTPAGTYTVVVTGTAASTSTLTHTINLTLTVN
jgi:VCBS repeat-containing protein